MTTEREIDQQLVERVQRGDKKAFELLVVKYQRKLMRLVSRLVRDQAEAEDVVQEAFIKLIVHCRNSAAIQLFIPGSTVSVSIPRRTIWSPWQKGAHID